MMPGRILCYVLMIIQWVVVYQSEQTTIVVISTHARFISAMPILLLGCVFTCYGPSAFYLLVVEDLLFLFFDGLLIDICRKPMD